MDQLLPRPFIIKHITTIIFFCQLTPKTHLQLVATSNIGPVAALAFADPEQWMGRMVDVVGDVLTPREMEAGWRAAKGGEMHPSMVGGSALSWVIKSATKDLRPMFKFFNEVGYNADIIALREIYPAMKDWQCFLRMEVKQ
ncbi:hypothetical protein B0H17DRAFT_1080382 [Mycena rosella]|uniref:NmrA-like domain-containing protein n=1 Tax=Mycena rosella TaxID=1033263 RepID=A0AAD7D6N7_MYCRO|nr:hypothetical protein B0H17DRAFT_1080382 [Mycena rosella]